MKRHHLWLTLPLGLWMSSAVALAGDSLPYLGDLTLRDGQKFTKVQVLKIEPDGLRVEHASGMGKLSLEQLPGDVAKRFNLSEVDAAEWRETEKKRKDAAETAERQAAVKRVLDASRADQEETVRQLRLALYQRLRSGGFQYVEEDTALRKSIALYKEAGREDLAALLEEDRDLLKQQEVYRPSAELESQKKQLADRVSQLEADLVNARNQPPTIIYSDPDPVFIPGPTIYYNPDPVVVPVPVPVNPAPCPPPVTRPPWVRPPATVNPLYPEPSYPNVPQAPPRTIGPRQPDVRQPDVRQPQVPPIAVRQPQVPPVAVRQPPVNQVPVRPVPVNPVNPAGNYRPAVSPPPAYRPSNPAPATRQAPPVIRPAPAAFNPARSPSFPTGGGGGARNYPAQSPGRPVR